MAEPLVKKAAGETPIRALPLRAPEGWSACLLPLVPVPMPLDRRALYASCLGRLVSRLRGDGRRTVFLDMEHLHRDNAVRLISRHGKTWGPEMGMGVEPRAAAPRMWTFAELSERDVREPLPPLIRNVCHLDCQEPAQTHAVETMCGTGGLVQVIHREPASRLLDEWSTRALATIQEEAFRAFPFYLPLWDASSIQHASPEQMQEWFGLADAYLRESVADRGLLVVMRQPLEAVLPGTGFLLPSEADA